MSSNGDGANGASEQESSANVGAERGVDEGQDVYISGGNSDNGKHAVSAFPFGSLHRSMNLREAGGIAVMCT